MHWLEIVGLVLLGPFLIVSAAVAVVCAGMIVVSPFHAAYRDGGKWGLLCFSLTLAGLLCVFFGSMR